MLELLKNAFKSQRNQKEAFIYTGHAGCDPFRITASCAGSRQTLFFNLVCTADGDAFNFFDAFTGGSF